MRKSGHLLSACVMASVGSAALLLPWAAPAAVPIEVVIASGDPLPASDPFDGSFVPVINDAGQLVFWSPDDLFTSSQFRWDPAPQLLRIVAPGLSAPGSGVFHSFNTTTTLNDAGETVLTAELEGFPADSPRIYRSDGAALVEIVRATEPAPGGNGTITTFSPGILNHAGEVAFIGDLSGTSGGDADAAALYRGDGATLLQIVRRGEPAPGGSGAFQDFSVPALNTQGELGFGAFLTGASGGGDRGFFRADDTPGGVVQIARRGQAAPGGGVLDLLDVSTPSFNESGQIAFVAGLANTVGGAFLGQAVLVGDGGALTEVARGGNAAPGGGTLSDLSLPLVNGAGQVAFAATLSGVGGSFPAGIFRRDGGQGALVPIVRTGQQAPDGDGTFDILEGFALNDAGQVAFRAYLTGGTGPADDHRLFLYDDAEGLVQLLRTGDPLLASTVLEMNLATQGGQHLAVHRALNDRGRVAFSFVLDDFRNGLAIAVPEPDAGRPIAVLIGLYGAARLRRGRSCAARCESFAMTSSA
jgi:hypothetical protein